MTHTFRADLHYKYIPEDFGRPGVAHASAGKPLALSGGNLPLQRPGQIEMKVLAAEPMRLVRHCWRHGNVFTERMIAAGCHSRKRAGGARPAGPQKSCPKAALEGADWC